MRPGLHMPHFRQRKHAATSEAEHHPESNDQRFWRVERMFDYLVVAGIVILGAVMFYGLATAPGEAPWF